MIKLLGFLSCLFGSVLGGVVCTHHLYSTSGLAVYVFEFTLSIR